MNEHEEIAKAPKARLSELRTHLAKVDLALHKPLPADVKRFLVVRRLLAPKCGCRGWSAPHLANRDQEVTTTIVKKAVQMQLNRV